MGIDNFDGEVACRDHDIQRRHGERPVRDRIGTKILNCGFEFISAGGTDIGAQIISWGSQKVGCGGTASNAVAYGGHMPPAIRQWDVGGTAIGATLSSNGAQDVNGGALGTT
jgi:hypothetical protein